MFYLRKILNPDFGLHNSVQIDFDGNRIPIAKFGLKIVCLVLSVFYIQGCSVLSTHHKKQVASLPTPKIPIILYHHVQDFPDSTPPAKRRWAVSVKKFSEQLDWIASQGYHPITMQRWLQHLKENIVLPEKPIIITFDDGWQDQFTTALPLLNQHHFVATFFIITNSVGHSAYLTWDEIQQMSDQGMDIQSHTENHKRLSILSDDKAREEIAGSKLVLETHLKKPIRILAYPYGIYDEDTIRLTKEAGYDMAVTVSGLNEGYLLRSDRTYTMDRYAIEWKDNLAGIARWKHF